MRKRLILGLCLFVGSCQGTSLRRTGSDGGGDAPASTGGTLASGGVVATGGSSGPGGSPGVGGNSGAGGLPRTGGVPLAGGVSSLGGVVAAPDAQLDLLPARDLPPLDTGGSSCEMPLPLRCGDRLNHSTLVQGRRDTWSTYGCTARWMSGRETIYAFRAETRQTVTARLRNSTPGLLLLQLPTCAMMSCRDTVMEAQTFTAEAGATTYLVVDGQEGAEGSYSLEVDCGNAADGGAIDTSRSDAARDAALPLACDPRAIAAVLSPLGLTALYDPTILNAALPATLAADPNWGLKATVCKAAGYDLDPVAGKTVCLIGQNITERCQGFPAKAWIVLDGGAVACVYKTVVDGFMVAPGVYSASDPACAAPLIATGASVACEGRTCTSETGLCCPALSQMNRTGMCSATCRESGITCDGSEDCPPGAVCCSVESTEGFWGASCVNASACVSPSRLICHQPADCPAGQGCVRPRSLPKEIPLTPDQAPSEWRVDYLVCAP